jgi:sigma-E factor negative regulatory protein RseA
VAGAQEVAGQGGMVQGATATETAPVMIRDPRLDELLAAHKQFSGASALQQPAGFLRNATFTPTGR